MHESPAHHTPNRRRQFLQGMGFVLLIALTMLVLTHAGVIHQWEMFGVDAMLQDDAHKASDIWLVQITDEDYKNLFNSTSPLARTPLQKLILSVAKAHPKLIVVDLDVSDSVQGKDGMTQEKFIQDVQEEIERIPVPRPIILWAQVTGPPNSQGQLTLGPSVQKKEGARFALPLFPRGRDGVVRSYLRTVDVMQDGVCRRWPTLPWAAFNRGTIEPERCPEKDSERSAEEESFYLNFSGDRFIFNRVDAKSIMEANSGEASGVLANNFAIIGGAYAAARDEYFTPRGPMQGMDLIAFALESELQHKGVPPIKEVYAFAFDLLLGAAILGIGYRLRGWAAIAGALAAAILLPIICSYLVYKTKNFLLNFVPVALGALLHIAGEAVVELPKKESEIEALAHENEKLRKDLYHLKHANLVHAEQERPPTVTVNVIQNVPPAQDVQA
jgi:CHASE2 domain-containing sensor protein